MKKLFFFLTVLSISSSAFAQPESPGALPQLLPATPDAAKLITVGLGDANKSSGAVQASVPLYELRLGALKLPIGLSYQSQGTKVEELCSRVGYGWVLNAGGVITRKVMGMPDERAAREAIPVDFATGTSQAAYDYLNNGKTNNSTTDFLDTQPDEFYFSFGGHSGKFVINDAGTPEIITHENLKITVTRTSPTPGPGVDITSITIVTPDGVTYGFGGNNGYEKTQSDGFLKGGVFPKTAFYLSTITLPSGDHITLTYNRVTTLSLTGFSETVSTPNLLPGSPLSCPAGHFIESVGYSFQSLTHDACYLSSIQTTTGSTVNFNYEPMADLSGDKRLIGLTVQNSNFNTVCQYVLTYSNCTGYVNNYPTAPGSPASGKNGRFFLKSVYQPYVNPDGGATDHIGYDFEYYGDPNNSYNSMSSVFAQDHFGFANGKGNQSLLPQPAAPDNFASSQPWGDRTPDASYAINGMLKSIAYPTTGTEEFTYEANTIATMEVIPVDGEIQETFHGVGSSGYGTVNSTYYDNFTVYKNQTAYINVGGSVELGCASPCPSFCNSVYCVVTDVTTSTTLLNFTMKGLAGLPSTAVTLQAGHSYQITTQMTGPACFHVQVSMSYDGGNPNPQPVNHITGGLRVSKISKHDPLTGKVLNTFFHYSTLADLTASSGMGYLANSYKSSSRTQYCDHSTMIPTCGECGHNIYSSNGIYNLFNLDNSHVYYTSIIQSDDASFLNGGIMYTYFNPVFADGGLVKRGDVISYPPDGRTPNYNGLLKSTTYFDAAKNIKKLEENEYEAVYSDVAVRSIYIRKNYEPGAFIVPPDPSGFVPFDVRECDYAPYWVRQTTKKTTDYENVPTGLQVLETYTYGTSNNVLPREITTTNSKGEEKKVTSMYVSDNPFSEAVVTTMQANYQLAEPVEEISKLNGNVLAEKHIQYKDWFSDGKIIEPQTIKVKQTANPGGSLEDRITFAAYDHSGNPVQLAKTQGSPLCYIWDYTHSLVTAEVKNATIDQVAYSSFEADGKGNWTYSGTPRVDNTAPTGRKVYFLSPGNYPYMTGLNNATLYIVSYWAKNSHPCNVNSSTRNQGKTVDGWTYYEHIVSPISQRIDVTTDSGYIDELRLYPKDAFMSTVTYDPLIGVTSQCDINNHITYFGYDGLNRLMIVRDQDKNILKKICYNYAGQVGDCGSAPLFYNQAISTELTRNNCGVGFVGSYVNYSVAAGTYNASTQAAADLLAQNDVTTNGQTLANSTGSCIATGTGTVALKNSFFASGFPSVTVQFIQNGTVVQTGTFPATATGTVNVTMPAGSYKIKLTVPSGYSTFSPVTYLINPGTIYVFPIDNQTPYTTGYMTLISGGHPGITITASDAQ